MNSATITARGGASNTVRVLTVVNRLIRRFATLRSYTQFLIANAFRRRPFGRPRAVVDLDNRFPDIHDRRYFFLILQTLVDAGYHVDVVWKISFSDFRRLYQTYEALIVRLRGLRVISKRPRPSKSAVLFTNAGGRHPETSWKKVIEMDCDVLVPQRAEGEFRMPYFMHPEQYKHDARHRLAQLHERGRKLRIFFSGNVAEEHYRHPLPGGKLNRVDIIGALREMPSVTFPASEREFRDVFSRGESRCLIHDRRHFAVADADWLDTIARSDFFLCLPGSRMPMCHNVIEAMAVGTIPILNYGDWFDPPLKHGETCMAFNTLEDVRARVTEALNLDRAAVERLRHNVINYYEEHLSPIGFRRKLEDAPNERLRLLVNTEFPWQQNRK